jgi:predicted acylesterase/phospholipase RssA
MTTPIQLAIQGGGAKITYLLAALESVQSLEREGRLRVTRIAGTSAGAIAGALYAAGVDMRRARDAFESDREQLLDAFPAAGVARCAWKLITRQPFWNAAPLWRWLMKLLAGRQTIGDLDIPLIVVASDLTNMRPCVYDAPEEPLASCVMDSAGIPFFFRTAPSPAHGNYRVVVDGGICKNLPAGELTNASEFGEVVGITFSASRARAPLTSFAAFTGALLETAMNASVLRSQQELGANNFVIHTEAGSFDFRRAFDVSLGAEYRETRLLADNFFRDYLDRGSRTGAFPQRRLSDVTGALRTMYERQHEPVRFEVLSVRMIVTGASQARAEPSVAVRTTSATRSSSAPANSRSIATESS